MKKYLISIIVLFLLMSTAAFAQDEMEEMAELPKYPEASTVSIGSGAHWGGMAGANFVSVPEDSQLGSTLGAGWSDVGDDQIGWNAGAVWRFLPEAGLFISYGTAGIFGLEDQYGTVLYDRTTEGITVSFGSVPVDSFDFVWRLGVALIDEDWADDDYVIDVGIGIAF